MADGKDIYTARCQGCHGARLEGGRGPQLSRQTLSARFVTAEQMIAFISKNMPANAPGSLAKEQYYAVAANILNQLGLLPPGQALTDESAPKVAIPK